MQHWVPLESDPDVFNVYASKLGLPPSWGFHDVYGLDADLLAMVPQPVGALILIFPLTPQIEHALAETDAPPAMDDDSVLWLKQTIPNACGTIAMLHAVANSPARDALAPEAPLAALLAAAQRVSPSKRPDALEASTALATAHAEAAQRGQTQAPDATDPVDLHFIALVRDPAEKVLVQLDGRLKGPVRHPDVPVPTQDDLLPAAARWIQDTMLKPFPAETNLNLIALAPNAA